MKRRLIQFLDTSGEVHEALFMLTVKQIEKMAQFMKRHLRCPFMNEGFERGGTVRILFQSEQ
jgi:hypothetical protein